MPFIDKRSPFSPETHCTLNDGQIDGHSGTDNLHTDT